MRFYHGCIHGDLKLGQVCILVPPFLIATFSQKLPRFADFEINGPVTLKLSESQFSSISFLRLPVNSQN